LLERENILLEINESDLKRIPAGPFLCISNRFLEGIDELILLQIFHRFDTPFKVVAPKNLLPTSLSGYQFILNENGDADYLKSFFKHLKTADDATESVGLLIDFFGGRFDSHATKRELNRLLKMVKKTGLPIVPLRLTPSVHPFFQSGLRAKLLKRAKQEPLTVTVRIGSPILVAEQQKFERISHFRVFLQSKIFALGSLLEVKRFFQHPFQKKPEQSQPMAEPIDNQLIKKEIQNLKFENLVTSQGDFDIFVAAAKDIPNTLLEIGRLREITFRSVGEGTGKRRDIDEFDLYYDQLIIWDREAGQIIGGYRIGKGDEIFDRYDLEGFYIHSLFKIKKGFFPIMQQSVELGRSFIVESYQRKRLPLFLLWKGILFFLLKNPQYRYLYGPVSISKYYSNISKSLIVAFIKKYYFDNELAAFLKPRKSFKIKTDKVDIDLLMENLSSEMKTLDHLVEDIEPQHFRIPVLIRQYLRLNARFISFNVDPNFSNCLDGFILLNLKDVPYSMMEALKREV